MESYSIPELNRKLIDEYLSSNVQNLDFEGSMIVTLLSDQNFDLIIYALNKGFKFTNYIYHKLVEAGEPKLCRYLNDRGIKISLYMALWVVINPKLSSEEKRETIKWMSRTDSKVLTSTLETVHMSYMSRYLFPSLPKSLNRLSETISLETLTALSGDLVFLKWLDGVWEQNRLSRRFWTYVPYIAAYAGHIHILKEYLVLNWARKHGHTPGSDIYLFAVYSDNIEILNLLKNRFNISPTNGTFYQAMCAKKIEMVKWCQKNITDLDSFYINYCISKIIEEGHLEFLKELHQVFGSIFEIQKSILYASICNQESIVEWLYSLEFTDS